MRWNEEVKGILNSLKVSGNFFVVLNFLIILPKSAKKYVLFFPETEVKKMTVPISMSEFPFYIIEKTFSLQ